jgi:tRNA pseudouridine38-40 synthase
VSAEEAPEDFQARRASLGKTYRYLIWNDPSPNPLLRHRSWYLKRPLNVDAIRASLPDLVGPQDFSSFRAAHCDAESTDRDMWRARWIVGGEGEESLHIFEVVGNAFLRNMVRIMVGSLVGIGLGHRPPGDLRRQLDARDRSQAGDTLPGHGLVLERVFLTASALYETLGREVPIYKTQRWPDP